jgi:hypothetical protein
LKSGNPSAQITSTTNSALIQYTCILCNQIISHDREYIDRKGKPIPLDEIGKNHHNCTAKGQEVAKTCEQ